MALQRCGVYPTAAAARGRIPIASMIPASLGQSRTASNASASLRKPLKVKVSNSTPRIDNQGLFKTYKPVSPGIRHLRRPVNDHLHKGDPFRSLTIAKRATGGRAKGSTGRVTVRGRGGGHKRRIRLVDFKRDGEEGEYECIRIEYDPGRSAHLALIRKSNPTPSYTPTKEDYSYIIAPDGLRGGDKIRSWRRGLLSTDAAAPQSVRSSSEDMPADLQEALLRSAALKPGNLLPLADMPLGLPIHNISLNPTSTAKICRAAGCYASVVSVGEHWAQVKMPSGEIRKIHKTCTATVGTVSNKLWDSRQLGKAGRSRWLGFRPKVRGVAMNAVDHPHGGGRGKGKGNKDPRSPTGVLAKGFRTRRPGPKGNQFVVKQRPRGKQQQGFAV